MAHQTATVDYSSRPRRLSDEYPLSPTFDWDETVYDDSELLKFFSDDPIHPSLGSPLSPLDSNDKYVFPFEKCNLDPNLPLSPPFTNSDRCRGRYGLGAVDLNRLITDMDTTYPNFATSASPSSVSLETTDMERDDRPIIFEDPITQAKLSSNMDVCNTPSPGGQSRSSYQRRNPKTRSPLTPAEEDRLLSIAMPSQSYPTSPLSSRPSPEPQEGRKPRSRTASESSESDCLGLRGKRTINKRKAHNAIEKRYRTNLVEKITNLRDSIPSLRVVNGNHSQDEDIPGLQSMPKFNKATILSKATEYIGHLEKSNKDLTRENRMLKTRIEAFKILLKAQGGSDSG